MWKPRTWRSRSPFRRDNNRHTISDSTVSLNQSVGTESQLTPPNEEDDGINSEETQSNSIGLSLHELDSQKVAPEITNLSNAEYPANIQHAGRSPSLSESSMGRGQNEEVKNAESELKAVSTKLAENYELFFAKHKQFVKVDQEIGGLIEDAGAIEFSRSSVILKQHIETVAQIRRSKEAASHSKWRVQIIHFLGALYPIARISIGVATAVAEGTNFLPLKAAGNGIALILQILEAETSRKGEFLVMLEEIAFQSSRLSGNRHIDIMLTSTNMQIQSIKLMIGILTYLNSTLLYFCKSFFVNLLTSIAQGSQLYEDGQRFLRDAIRRYNESICDFTAACVIEERLQTLVSVREIRDEKFLQCLLPSHWQIEAHEQLLRRSYQRAGTLQLAHRMEEFQQWLGSNLLTDCKKRILLIVGPPGVGKSTLAAYFVEFVRCLDQESILAHFFVRPGVAGLAKPSDIVRTLAYYLSTCDVGIRSLLQDLKVKGFRVDDGLGLRFLFTKLLSEPLARCTKPIYLILDGLDEADRMMDSVDRRRESIEILIECLCSLPSTRLCFLSRPQRLLSIIKPHSIVKSLGFNDNKTDIETYVKQQFSENKILQVRFAKEKIDPVPFLVCNSNGIFLWVVLLLEQLSKTESSSEFRQYVLDVTKAPSDITQLYSNILRRLSEEQRKWVREILHWVLGARRQLKIDELRNAVEWCMGDELINFREFLEVHCGSILVVTEPATGPAIVQIVHETLRAFLFNSQSCPSDFHLSAEEVHSHLAVASLDLLAKEDNKLHPIYNYTIASWNYHLIRSKGGGHYYRILSSLYHFFHSPKLAKWICEQLIRHQLQRHFQTEIENKILRDVGNWLAQYDGPDGEGAEEVHNVGLHNMAIQWRASMVENRYALGEYIGKAATFIWLFEDLKTTKPIKAAFNLATKYYWLRGGGFEIDSRDELERLIETDFAPMLTWAGQAIESEMVNTNVEVARETLKQWNECRAFRVAITSKAPQDLWREIGPELRTDSEHPESVTLKSSPEDFKTSSSFSWHGLPSADTVLSNLHNTVELSKFAVLDDPSDCTKWCELADAYRAINQYEEAIDAYKNAINIDPREQSVYGNLADTYRVIGRYDKSIQALEMSLEQNPDAEAWAALGWAFRAIHQEDKATEYFTRSVQRSPALSAGWKGLADIYNIKQEFHKTIEMCEKESVANPACSWVSLIQGQTYQAQGKITEAIKSFQVAVEKNPGDSWAWTCLADGYRVDQQYAKAIHRFWASIEKNPGDSWPWKGLAESYAASDDVARAIAVYIKAVERLPNDYTLRISLGRLLNQAGQYRMASECFTAAIAQCPDQERLLWVFINLPTSHMFSNYPIISIDDNITSSLLWMSLAEALRELNDQVRTEGVWDKVIHAYKFAIEHGSENDLLWIYSSLLASRGLDPFEKRVKLPTEVLWTILGEAYVAKGDYLEAVECYVAAVEILPNNKWLWTRLGDVYRQCGNADKESWAHNMAAKVRGHYSKTVYCY